MRSLSHASARLVAFLALALGLGLSVDGCGDRGSPRAEGGASETATGAPAAGAAADSAEEAPGPGKTPAAGGTASAEPPRVVFLGDSLTAGLGLGEEQAFPAVVGRELAAAGRPIRVVNAGVSGDTSAGGLARLDWILRQQPDVVVVELGPNDGLRGLPLAMTEDNLRRIVERSLGAGARVLLVGMQIPPNYGADYAGAFHDLYPRLAAELDVPLVPFLLEGVGGEPDLNLPDGIHPNAEGHRRAAANVLPHLRAVLDDLKTEAQRAQKAHRAQKAEAG
jgi:acyl-CoA thioesterase-1